MADNHWRDTKTDFSWLGQQLKNSEARLLLVESKGLQPMAWQYNSVHLNEEKECLHQGRNSSRRLLHPKTTENIENSILHNSRAFTRFKIPYTIGYTCKTPCQGLKTRRTSTRTVDLSLNFVGTEIFFCTVPYELKTAKTQIPIPVTMYCILRYRHRIQRTL